MHTPPSLAPSYFFFFFLFLLSIQDARDRTRVIAQKHFKMAPQKGKKASPVKKAPNSKKVKFQMSIRGEEPSADNFPG